MVRTIGTLVVLVAAQGLAALFPRGSWEWWFCAVTAWIVIAAMLWSVERRLEALRRRLFYVEHLVERELEKYEVDAADSTRYAA